MSDAANRPPVRVRFRFNIDTGEMELIVDDISPDRSEEYHNKVAEAIASYLARNPDVQDAGAIRHRLDQERQARYQNRTGPEKTDEEKLPQ
ncbi:MAG TPA: hypothetical protein VKT82_34190 [Ktedonobacterales bacterium]|nr:hypothetical protein [Ktedonobacterales bacterium]